MDIQTDRIGETGNPLYIFDSKQKSDSNGKKVH